LHGRGHTRRIRDHRSSLGGVVCVECSGSLYIQAKATATQNCACRDVPAMEGIGRGHGSWAFVPGNPVLPKQISSWPFAQRAQLRPGVGPSRECQRGSWRPSAASPFAFIRPSTPHSDVRFKAPSAGPTFCAWRALQSARYFGGSALDGRERASKGQRGLIGRRAPCDHRHCDHHNRPSPHFCPPVLPPPSVQGLCRSGGRRAAARILPHGHLR
jgi:hypothetical protein